MKCAMEIREIKEQARIEREIRKMEQLARDTVKFEEIKNNTIAFCETVIAEEIEKSAAEGSDISILEKFSVIRVFDSDSSFRKEIFIKRLTLDNHRYANGNRSYIPTGEPFHLETLKEYLESFCYIVTIYEDSYKHYGYGSMNAKRIIVKIPNELPCD